MADPVTGAMVGLQVAGKLFGAMGQASADKAAARADDATALQQLAQGSAEEASARGRARATQGDALVAEGMSGAQVGTGSALEALRQNAVNSQFDILNARNQAASRANASYADAAAKRQAASGALIGGVLGAAGSALSGVAAAKKSFGPVLPGTAGAADAGGGGDFDLTGGYGSGYGADLGGGG